VTQYKIVFTPEALEQLAALYRYIAVVATPEIAERYTDAIITFCEALQTFPHRANRRDDIRPGLRVTNYRKRTVIAFDVDTERVSIIGVFYGGQDYETVLQSESDESG
jgi:plasmid stabilization system protein ParE